MKWIYAPTVTTIFNKIEISEKDTLYLSAGFTNFNVFKYWEQSITVYSDKENIYYHLIVNETNKEETIERIMGITKNIRDQFTFSYLLEQIIHTIYMAFKVNLYLIPILLILYLILIVFAFIIMGLFAIIS